MAVAGYGCTVKASGAAVAMTAEACALVSGNIYQITNTAKRIVDPATTLTVYENGIASVLAYTFNYLYGIVTFPSAPTTPITVTGAYLPVASVAESKGFTISLKPDLLDVTSFDSSGARSKRLGLLDADFKLERLSMFDDIDPVTGGLQTVESRFAAGTAYLLEFGLGGVYTFRAWVIAGELEASAEHDGLVAESVSFSASPQRAGAAWAFSA